MTELIRVDFKQKKVLGRNPLGVIANPEHFSYTCICCGGTYTTDKNEVNYSQMIEWESNLQGKPFRLCFRCIDDLYNLKGHE